MKLHPYKIYFLAITITLNFSMTWESAAENMAATTVYVAGDIAKCGNRPAMESAAAKTANIIEAGMKDDADAFVISLGDNTYPDGAAKEFESCFEPTWGRFKQRIHPSVGNHEYHLPSAQAYYSYFGAAAGAPAQGYYSFNTKNWHLIALNSNLKDADLQAQLEWLKQDLVQNKSSCTVAYWHHPLYSSGGHGNDTKMRVYWDLLKAAKVDLVLNGHDHDYERFAPQDQFGNRDDNLGIREFVVGTGGATLSAFLIHRANSEARFNDNYGVLKLVLKAHSFDWDFLGVAPSDFSDKGSAQCHR